MNSAISAASPSVPIISVTPHSPAGIGITPLNKQYAVLGLIIQFFVFFPSNVSHLLEFSYVFFY